MIGSDATGIGILKYLRLLKNLQKLLLTGIRGKRSTVTKFVTIKGAQNPLQVKYSFSKKEKSKILFSQKVNGFSLI